MIYRSATELRSVLSRRTLVAGIGGSTLALATIANHKIRVASGQEATPEITTVDDPFLELARLVPDPYPAASTSSGPLFYYADIAGQLAALGLSAPADRDSDEAFLWGRALSGAVLPSELSDALRTPDWESMFGWSPFQVDQSLWFGDPPNVVALLRGRFDTAAVEAALMNLDYRAVEIPGAIAAYSIEHKELSLADPVERILFTSSLRTLAILPDGAYVWGQQPGPVQAVAEVATGAPSLLDRSPVASLLAAVEAPLASSILVPGLALQGIPFDPLTMIETAPTPGAIDAMATSIASAEAAFRAMPPVGLVLLGLDYGGEFVNLDGTPEALSDDAPPNRFRFYLQFGSQSDAATAAEVIHERLETGGSQQYELPWTELLRGWEVSVTPDQSVVRVVLDPGMTQGLWINLLFSRDLGFLAW